MTQPVQHATTEQMEQVDPAILRAFPELNDAQRQAIASTEGPVLLIAGPGTGKTLVLVLRTLNLIMRGLAKPREIVLCTFTEKVALELRDRIAAAAQKVGCDEDRSELLVGTIHGICNDFIERNRHRTRLGNNYEVLDELTQKLFVFEHFSAIVGEERGGRFLGRWSSKWRAIDGICKYFDKVTEELIESQALADSSDPFLQELARAYDANEAALYGSNKIDFAHLQKIFLELLRDKDAAGGLLERTKYVLVDEYQDTNYVQERLLARLAGRTGNLCVVGDEDQSLYRFRGATVRNILEFPTTFPGCRSIQLGVNYRSHPKIVAAYDKFMRSWDWSSKEGRTHRFPKTIQPDPEAEFPDYPAVFSIWGEHHRDEANRFADFVRFLKDHDVIEDYSQVALLLHSVRSDLSGPYLEALERVGIPSYCPRARAYFENEEVRQLVGCLALILGYHGDGRGNLQGSLRSLADFVDECIVDLARSFQPSHPLIKKVRASAQEIEGLREIDALDRRLVDYVYVLLALEPFATYIKNENRARNLAIFTQLVSTFQTYYRQTVITGKGREYLRFTFFNSFLRLIHQTGINEHEDPDQPLPRGHVQVMTIHQAKGLEFPIVVVGSLSARTGSPKEIDRTLGPLYHRPQFEPEDRITGFDRMRLHYVAFSRAEKVLVLTTTDDPQPHFRPISQGLPQWPYVQQDVLKGLSFPAKVREPPKRTYGFTSDLRAYETCPRQYEYYHEFSFAPSRSADVFFGQLVHQTIEDLHRWVLDGKLESVTEERIRGWFDFNFRNLQAHGIRPIGQKQKTAAFRHVTDYFTQNRSDMQRVFQTEVDVSLEKEGYILVGKVDLVRGKDDKLELLDFKAQTRPVPNDPRIPGYHKQLCIYAHILEQRTGKRPERLILYWTGERTRDQAAMVFPYEPERVEAAVAEFDAVVAKIRAKDFTVHAPPPKRICKECDFRPYCAGQGTITIDRSEVI